MVVNHTCDFMLNFNYDKTIISLMKYNARWKQQKNPSDKIVLEVGFQIYDWNESFYSGISYKISFLPFCLLTACFLGGPHIKR